MPVCQVGLLVDDVVLAALEEAGDDNGEGGKGGGSEVRVAFDICEMDKVGEETEGVVALQCVEDDAHRLLGGEEVQAAGEDVVALQNRDALREKIHLCVFWVV